LARPVILTFIHLLHAQLELFAERLFNLPEFSGFTGIHPGKDSEQ
jgi:hypothetical protein